MAKITDVNTTPANGAEASFDLKENLKAAGWTVPSSSDGLTYNAAGDQITVAGSGAGGMDNNRAWFRIQDPDGRREMLFQRGDNEQDWRMRYSALSKFVTGSPGITQCPEAADEGELEVGNGTAAAPTFTEMWPTVGTYRAHHVAQDAADGDVYGWWSYASLTGTGDPWSLHFMEPMSVGSYPAEDVDPVILGAYSGGTIASSSGMNLGSTNVSHLAAWHAYGLPEAAYENTDTSMATYNGSNGYPSNSNSQDASGYNGRDDQLPIPVLVYAVSTPKWKGFCAHLRYNTFVQTGTGDRSYPDTVGTTDTRVYFDALLIPFEDGTAPII